MKTNQYFPGVGRRKAAIAQVRVTAGGGAYLVNGHVRTLPTILKKVLQTVGKEGQLDISAVTRGGGQTGQLDAVVLGLARALVALNGEFKSSLRKAGYLTRDARIKERKKPGLKKARRAPQWAKR